ncbi:MAG: phosphoribosylanthranilate isomerase [Candidatus Omnitrophota bacterium]|nr:MAG: phosphoribosylanthranilate isomerase [Candidatus Omnitrophota bacterium]
MLKVKICGITNLGDALFCSQEGADALGFIFSRLSPRCINTKTAGRISQQIGPFINKVGVFVNEKKDKVLKLAQAAGLDTLQFHGREEPSYCRTFKARFKVIKVLFPQDRPFKKTIRRYKGVDAFLFDVKYENKLEGKNSLSGSVLSEISSLIKEGCRVIISGGLNPGNLSRVGKIYPYAVDVASGVEKYAGKKDKTAVRAFIRKAKAIVK